MAKPLFQTLFGVQAVSQIIFPPSIARVARMGHEPRREGSPTLRSDGSPRDLRSDRPRQVGFASEKESALQSHLGAGQVTVQGLLQRRKYPLGYLRIRLRYLMNCLACV